MLSPFSTSLWGKTKHVELLHYQFQTDFTYNLFFFLNNQAINKLLGNVIILLYRLKKAAGRAQHFSSSNSVCPMLLEWVSGPGGWMGLFLRPSHISRLWQAQTREQDFTAVPLWFIVTQPQNNQRLTQLWLHNCKGLAENLSWVFQKFCVTTTGGKATFP